MGLDAGFQIKKYKPDEETFNVFDIAYFRNFHELDDWIRYNCMEKSDKTYEVSLEDLKRLKEDLLPIAKILINVPERLMSKYDDHGYPKKYKLDAEELIHEDFNPITSRSAFAGCKTMKLYNAVCTMIDILEDDCSCELFVEYWDSF